MSGTAACSTGKQQVARFSLQLGHQHLPSSRHCESSAEACSKRGHVGMQAAPCTFGQSCSTAWTHMPGPCQQAGGLTSTAGACSAGWAPMPGPYGRGRGVTSAAGVSSASAQHWQVDVSPDAASPQWRHSKRACGRWGSSAGRHAEGSPGRQYQMLQCSRPRLTPR